MQHLSNSMRGVGLSEPVGAPAPSTDAAAPAALLRRCPAHAETLLVAAPSVATVLGADAAWVKDERGRMGLGSFKALGAAYVIACDAVETGATDLTTALTGRTYITASAGNHGMSVAAGARVFGAKAIVHIAETVPESFAERLRDKGAEVVRAGVDYEESMALAKASAEANGHILLSDSSWPGYMDRPHRLMEGYLQMAAEAFDQIPTPPTHIFLQAGVGGLAGAVAALARARFGKTPRIVVVEPGAAPALYESIKAGTFVSTSGPVSAMGRLDCKEASLIALTGLARDADDFVTITEEEAAAAMPLMADAGLAGSESGIAGVAGAIVAARAVGLDAGSNVLFFLSEGVA
ncbi:pyridoxal-phosphate dependent enzyme [Loktanella sp. IMCC34160]|uniref:pyridoxal-phosphate dependent enzyme n=1 Tax=Loktanella sp. IMCC34160 TaxID=2510646 RepID=UPI00101D3305|nr:pyridoxal-phosphate dependent enzyme [Loktanella sp. IMCC34160]RYG91491.1 pyridoxal-phosphate dependent enzyme [Loktanella sp. IMCC34160]